MNKLFLILKIGISTTIMLLLVSFSLNAQRFNPLQNTLVKSGEKVKVTDFKTPKTTTYSRNGVTVTTLVNDYMFPYDISQNGQYVAGQGFGEAISFFWSETTGSMPITGTCYAVSETGMIGGYYMDETLGASVAGLWDPSTQAWTFLGINPDFPELNSDYNSIWGMNSDGSICVGMQFNSAWMAFPFKWTFEGGYELLSYPEEAYASRPDAVSDDGSVICGHIDWNPAVWYNNTYTIISDNGGEAFNVSPNGLYVVGSSGDNGFIWNSSTQTTEFFTNSLQTGSLAPICVSNDGTIFGYSATGFPPSIYDRVAFVRLPDGTMQTFNDYAADRGLTDAGEWQFYSINSVTGDGTMVIGAGIDPEGQPVSFKMFFDNIVYNCNPPSNLTYEVTDQNWDDIILSWDAPENATNVTYYLYASAGSTTPLFTGLTETTFTDMDKPAGTYTYVVRANWSDTCLSAASDKVTVTINDCATAEMCNLIFNMTDNYGDGWNGGSIQITNAEGTTVANVTMTDGSSEQKFIPFCPGTLHFIWNAGDYDEECGFSISDEFGVTLYTQTPPPFAGEFFTHQHQCSALASVIISGTVSALTTETPIENAVIVFNGNNVYQTTTNESGYYEIELNSGFVFNISITADGFIPYFQNDFSVPEENATLDFEMTLIPCNLVPQNVAAVVDENEITVSWEIADVENWLTWTGTYENNSVGTGGTTDFDVAQRFEPADLTDYNGSYLTKIQFIPAVESSSCEYSVRVWTGGSAYQAGNLVVDQVIPAETIVVGEWNEITLNTPVFVDASQELWFGIRCNAISGYPAGCDAGPALTAKGDLIFFQGAWNDVTALASELNYNWCLKGLVTNQAKGNTTTLAALKDVENRAQDESATWTTHSVPMTTSTAVTSNTFSIYRDGIIIAEGLSEMTYTDSNLENGTYCYTVSATCQNNVESELSEEACATVSVGINETSAPYDIFPNPADNMITIKGETIDKIVIYNILGQNIENISTTNSSILHINTASYTNGTYILRIYTLDGATISKRIVIAH
ncbi:MAG: T9SS type A sorting domain-containing protein [Bacteroidales bacterium]|nr:T9SS type A sorting domain-containing protein [Bacteroidales bacterium]